MIVRYANQYFKKVRYAKALKKYKSFLPVMTRQHHIPWRMPATIYKIIKTKQTVTKSNTKMYFQTADRVSKMATMSAMCHAREWKKINT